MRKLYLILGLLIGSLLLGQAVQQLLISTRIASGGGINTTPLQNLKCHNTSGVCTFVGVTAGSALVMAFENDSNSTVFSGCTDDKSNTWTQRAMATSLATNGSQIFIAQNAAAGTTVVTCVETVTTGGVMYLLEYAGVSTTAAYDDDASSTGGLMETSVGPVTASTDNELIIIVGQGNGTDDVPCSGYTTLNSGNFNAFTFVQQFATSAAGNYTATGCTAAVFFNNYAMVIIKS